MHQDFSSPAAPRNDIGHVALGLTITPSMISRPAVSLRDVLLVGLTFASGAIDATSFLGLGRVFTANMTGNMVLLGLAVSRVQGLEVLRSGTAFGGFILGVALGARLLGRALKPELWPRRVTIALAMESLLLAALALGWALTGASPQRPWLEVLIALSAGAMGIQSIAAQRLAVPSVSTTYVTGTLTSAVAELALLGHPTTGWPLRAGIVFALGVGAGVNALVLLRLPLLAPVIPLAALVLVTATARKCFPSG
ncbi:MAG TPA: YoaK family protein [Chloroflexota bacterium]